MEELKQKIENLSVLLLQAIIKDKRKFDVARDELIAISKHYFNLDVDNIEEIEVILPELDISFFQNKFSEINPDELQQLFLHFLKFRKLAYKLNSIVLEDTAINKEIQAKFCKIVSPYGEGTGYIIDDKNGLIISSFHLISAVKPLSILKVITNPYILSVLYSAGYIDKEY
ncbi:MAG: hypothetical protein K2X39_05170, partial [Silvanigrellaceae bacterium]|nr:hypothetical protein [Silvanigrellaceae bacterium]